MHVGAGRTAVSSGFGPLTTYSTVGAGRRGPQSSPARQTSAQIARQRRDAELAHDIAHLQAQERAITTLHVASFPPVERAVFDIPKRDARTSVTDAVTARALQGIPWYRRSDRASARATAASEAERILAALHVGDTIRMQLRQRQSDEVWARLTAHDPMTVITTVDDAFADNASESTCIDAGTSSATGRRYVTTVVQVGTVELISDRKAAVTPTGRPSLQKRTKTERNGIYLQFVASTVLATAKEALAMSPSTDDIHAVVLQGDADSPERPRPIYVGSFDRDGLDGLDWSRVDPVAVLLDRDCEISLKGVAKTVSPLKDVGSIEAIAAEFARQEGDS